MDSSVHSKLPDLEPMSWPQEMQEPLPELSPQMASSKPSFYDSAEPFPELSPLMQNTKPKARGLFIHSSPIASPAAPFGALSPHEPIPEPSPRDRMELAARMPSQQTLNKVYNSLLVEKRCSFQPLRNTQSMTSSRAVENCSFYGGSSKVINVTSSARVERQCSFLNLTPSSVNCFSSRRAEACTFPEPSTPSAAVVTTSVLEKQCSFWSEFDAEKLDIFTTEPTQMFLTDEEEMVPLEASKPRTWAPRVQPLFSSRQAAKCSFYGKAPSVPVASFASSRAEKQCDFGCAVWDDEGLLFLVDRNLNTMPEDPVVVPVQDYWRPEVNCQNIRLLEKMCSFHDVTPKPTFSSKQASRCTFYAKEPSKPPSVITNGMLEKMCSFHTVRPMPLTSSRAVEQCTFYCKEPSKPVSVVSSSALERQCSFYGKEPSKPTRVFSSSLCEAQCSFLTAFDTDAFSVFEPGVRMHLPEEEEMYTTPACGLRPLAPAKPLGACSSRQVSNCSFYAKEPSTPTRVFSSALAEKQCSFLPEFDVAKFDLFGEPQLMCLPEPDDEANLPGAPQSPQMPTRRASAGVSSRQVAMCSFYAQEPSKPTRVFSSSASERCSFLDLDAEFSLFAPAAQVVFAEDVVQPGRGFKLFTAPTLAPPLEPEPEASPPRCQQPDILFNVSDEFDVSQFDVFAVDAPQMPWPDEQVKPAPQQDSDLFAHARSLVD